MQLRLSRPAGTRESEEVVLNGLRFDPQLIGSIEFERDALGLAVAARVVLLPELRLSAADAQVVDRVLAGRGVHEFIAQERSSRRESVLAYVAARDAARRSWAEENPAACSAP